MKTAQIIVIFLLLLFSSCNNAQTKSGSTSEEETTTPVATNLSTETVLNSNRLTENALLSYFPKTFLGLKEDGVHDTKTIGNTSKNRVDFTITNKTYNNATLDIDITDYSDDERHREAILKNSIPTKNQKTKYLEVKSYKDTGGNFITETKTNTSSYKDSRVTVQNARFKVYVYDKKGKKSPKEILNALKKSSLYQIFKLPIPEKKIVEEPAVAKVERIEKKVLNCDELLPISVVKTICNKTVTIKSTSFEKEYNCNRFYPDKNSTGALIFLVTQYSRAYTAKSAVTIDKGKVIPNLGDNAIYIKENSGDEYLKVNYKNFLLELRSSKGFDKEGVCYSEKELIKLMKGILNRL